MSLHAEDAPVHLPEDKRTGALLFWTGAARTETICQTDGDKIYE